MSMRKLQLVQPRRAVEAGNNQYQLEARKVGSVGDIVTHSGALVRLRRYHGSILFW